MQDYKNRKPVEALTRGEILLGAFFVLVTLGSWLLINLWRV